MTIMLKLFTNKQMIYEPNEINLVLDRCKPMQVITSNKKIKYYNIPCAFDIETSSFYNESSEKVAIMYEWTFGIGDNIIIGRTWGEFVQMVGKIADILKLDHDKRLIIYVHNLEFEFQFMRHWLSWSKIFASESRRPIYALTDTGLEFRCSYILSGYSLDKLASQLVTQKISKLKGQLDYNKIRHSKSTLTNKEIEYCVNDVRIILAYIAERMAFDGDITQIPLTKTGYVRNYCRRRCFLWPQRIWRALFQN